MFGPLTPAVERACAVATRWAHQASAREILPIHVVLGLLDEDEGHVAQLLALRGQAARALQQTLAGEATLTGNEPKFPLPLSPATESLFRHARELAADTSAERTVSTELLFLAALRTDASLRQTLEPFGLTLPFLEERILAESQAVLSLDEPLRLGAAREETDLARILDASANRAREALRVLEDHCRFVLDDPFLSSELKRLRHDLAGTLEPLPGSSLLAARETLRDVGTAITTAQEQQRFAFADVLQANAKRLQEALRSLEEFGKLHGPDFGRAVEALRYRAYTLERALVLGLHARERLREVSLCVLVTGARCAASLTWTIQEAVAGGASMIQLREKELEDRELLDRARRVRDCTHKLGVLFVVNDRPDIARIVNADGVHLGQDDLPVKEARRIVGPEPLIGVSTHNLEQLQQAVLDGASYVGVGPTFPSSTKEFAEFPGLEFVRQATAATTLPAFIIGGVNLDTVSAAVAAGARRVAVSQAVCQADDPRAVAVAIKRVLE